MRRSEFLVDVLGRTELTGVDVGVDGADDETAGAGDDNWLVMTGTGVLAADRPRRTEWPGSDEGWGGGRGRPDLAGVSVGSGGGGGRLERAGVLSCVGASSSDELYTGACLMQPHNSDNTSTNIQKKFP